MASQLAGNPKFIEWFQEQSWYIKDQELTYTEEDTVFFCKVAPLPLSAYKKIFDTWNGWPIFQKEEQRVQLFDLFHSVLEQKPSIEYSAQPGKFAGRIVSGWNDPYPSLSFHFNAESQPLRFVARPSFPNIKYYAAMALGLPPPLLKIDGNILPPKGVLTSVECFALMLHEDGNKRWGILNPLSLEECERLPNWKDRLPVFKDEQGNLVRPHILLDPTNTPVTTRPIDPETYFGPVITVMSMDAQVFDYDRVELSKGSSVVFGHFRPLFNDPL